MNLRERIGEVIGKVWSPAVATISALRHARMFHPSGLTFRGRVTPIECRDFAPLGARFGGEVLFRASAALSKEERRLDVLGIALRFDGGQDLLFATIRSPLTMGLALFATKADDYFANQYWAVSPFDAEGVGTIKLRLTPARRPLHMDGRDATLRAAVDRGDGIWILEARRTFHREWAPIARIDLVREVAIDQDALQFDPFHAGLGLEPRGLVHAIRRAVYPASQAGRGAE